MPTGVPGLDHVLMGGFLREGFYLVQGDPGSGKTTVALQYVLGRVEAGEPCLYITLTESRGDLENACRSHGWSLDGLEVCDLTESAANLAGEPESSVFHPSETELGETTQAILAAVEKAKPAARRVRRPVRDAAAVRQPARLPPPAPGAEGVLRRAARPPSCCSTTGRRRSATSSPRAWSAATSCWSGPCPQYGRARRRLYVTKVRGSNFREGYHDYEIVQGGVVVHPRLVAAEHHETFDARGLPERRRRTSTRCSPAASRPARRRCCSARRASGKSTVAMQFVVDRHEGRATRPRSTCSTRCSTPWSTGSRSSACGKEGGLRAFIADGLLHAQQVDPAEMSPGAFAHEVRRAVEAGAKVIIIDSLNGYLNAMPEERFLTTHLHEMFAYLNQKGVVTIMVVAQHGMIVGGGMAGDVDVSYLADTVLLFRYFEAAGEIRQAISVFKKRTGEHERTLRELKISGQGRGGRRAAARVPRGHDRRAAVRGQGGDAARRRREP